MLLFRSFLSLVYVRRYAALVSLLVTELCVAGALDRSGQPIAPIFEEGTWVEYRQSYVYPEVSGVDTLGNQIDSVSQNYILRSLALKTDVSDQWAVALLVDEPWNGDFDYAPSSVLYGGTLAKADSMTLTPILRYTSDRNVSVYAGPRWQNFDGELRLDGAAFGPLAGYQLTADDDWATGYMFGASYSMPDYGARVAFTYHSEIAHKLSVRESISPVPTTAKINTPQSVNLGFRTGVAEATLLYGQVRWVDWTEFQFQPEALGQPVASFDEDMITYTLGVARQFSSALAGTVTFRYEPTTKGQSLFRPTNGYRSLTLGANYQFVNKLQIGVAFSYAQPGDADVETPGGNSVSFQNSDSLAATFRIARQF